MRVTRAVATAAVGDDTDVDDETVFSSSLVGFLVEVAESPRGVTRESSRLDDAAAKIIVRIVGGIATNADDDVAVKRRRRQRTVLKKRLHRRRITIVDGGV